MVQIIRTLQTTLLFDNAIVLGVKKKLRQKKEGENVLRLAH